MVKLESVLVATDFGEAADVAVRYGRELARKFGATLELVHVVDDLASRAIAASGGVINDLNAAQVAAEEDAGRRLSALLSDEDRQMLRATTTVLASNSPASAIVSLAREKGAGLVVVGTHGRGPIAHFFLGGVAERVVRIAPCPVLTVRHPETEFVLPDALQKASRQP
jgi:nucleotide-binding universal stress UspA family protein